MCAAVNGSCQVSILRLGSFALALVALADAVRYDASFGHLDMVQPAANITTSEATAASSKELSMILEVKAMKQTSVACLGLFVLGLICSAVYFTGGRTSIKQQGQASPGPAVSETIEARSCPGYDSWLFSLPGITLLTSYKLYVGFMSSTWVPFLVAKEGEKLMGQDQSIFMGACKLLYGGAVFLNPFFGLISDQMASHSPKAGRSVFIFVGVAIEGVAIFSANMASSYNQVGWYLAASALWMLCEAVVDVTSEAVLPELLPRNRYDLASSVRAVHFLIGGIAGYVALHVMVGRGRGFSWIYKTYMALMLICAIPSLVLTRILASQSKRPQLPSQRVGMGGLLYRAFAAPLLYPGGFPHACLCLFIFSFGTAPVFFTLLLVRDLIGYVDETEQQQQFAGVSLVFLASAAISSVAAGRRGGPSDTEVSARSGMDDNDRLEATGITVMTEKREACASSLSDGSSGLEVAGVAIAEVSEPPYPNVAVGSTGHGTATPLFEMSQVSEDETVRWVLMLASIIFYVVACLCFSLLLIPTQKESRMALFYVLSSQLGFAFGSVYVRFKTCLWFLLPVGVDSGNAMGFAAVAQFTGIGIGNFLAGIMLDQFKSPAATNSTYTPASYVVLYCCSAGPPFLSAILLVNLLLRKKGVPLPCESYFWKLLRQGSHCSDQH